MEYRRKMVSDSLIVIGVILVVFGWRGLNLTGFGGIASYGLILVGLILGIWGLIRYARGHDQPQEPKE